MLLIRRSQLALAKKSVGKPNDGPKVRGNALGADPQDPPSMSDHALTIPISNIVAPPMHYFNALSDGSDPTEYFRYSVQFHIKNPCGKLEWKPRLLASLWVHSLSPIDWAPRKWVAKSNHSLGYYDLTRNLINVEWWTVYMYLIIFGVAVSFVLIRTYLYHPNITLIRANSGWYIHKPYYVTSHNDNMEYRDEGGPYQNRGGGKYYHTNFRIIDRHADDFMWFGARVGRNSGPNTPWMVNDPYKNPLARAPPRF